MRVVLILALLFGAHAAWADDLDVIADPGSTPEARREAYERLVKQEFTNYARKLVKLCGTH
ncbi:MAG: hypothetical protein ACAI34_12545, partial [Verrucomicrobium sp.]